MTALLNELRHHPPLWLRVFGPTDAPLLARYDACHLFY